MIHIQRVIYPWPIWPSQEEARKAQEEAEREMQRAAEDSVEEPDGWAICFSCVCSRSDIFGIPVLGGSSHLVSS